MTKIAKQILDIKGYREENDSMQFKEKNSWKGSILVDENLSFEGIVYDESDETKSYVAGTLGELNGIALRKFRQGPFADAEAYYGMSDGKMICGVYGTENYLFGVGEMENFEIHLNLTEYNESQILALEEQCRDFKRNMNGVQYEMLMFLNDTLGETSEDIVSDTKENHWGFEPKKLELTKPFYIPNKVSGKQGDSNM